MIRYGSGEANNESDRVSVHDSRWEDCGFRIIWFEGGAGETVRCELLKQADVHTLLRLPTGIFYAQGVKANVLFFDRKPAQETPWTKQLWIYDLRTNRHFMLKENTPKRSDLVNFVA